MHIKDDEKFIKTVEKLIDPAEVCYLYFFAGLKKLLPKKIFKRLLNRTSKKTPYMGFVIDPYCLFLFFELKDIEKARQMLPERYRITKARIFADEEPRHYVGMGIFNTRASTFWGTRLECYLIAEDTETGLPSWIFIDIISNTIIALPTEGVAARNSSKAMYTSSSKGDIYLDISENRSGRRIELKGNILNAGMRNLDQPLWIMGNTSIAHSKELAGAEEDPFAVIFDPAEVEKALDIPLNDIEIKTNTLFPELAEPELVKAVCFPFAQHYIADSPGCRTYVKTPDDMVDNYNRISEIPNLKTFSTKIIRFQFFLGIAVSSLLSVALIIMLLMKI